MSIPDLKVGDVLFGNTCFDIVLNKILLQAKYNIFVIDKKNKNIHQ